MDTNWKRGVKALLLGIDIIVHTSGPKKSTKELLQLINTFSEVARYKINSKNSETNTNQYPAILYTN